MKRLLMLLTILILGVVGLRLAWRIDPGDLPVLGSVPSFELTTQDARPFNAALLAAGPSIVSFIYSTCPGPCPRVVDAIAAVDRRLSHDPRIRLIGISVDPAADTPEVLAVYARTRGLDSNRWTFLTGDADAVFSLVRDGFKLGVERNDREDLQDLGPVVHSTHAALVDRSARIRGYYDTNDRDAMARLVRDARRLADDTK